MHALLPGTTRKYLLFLSYIGNEFRGMQKQKPSVIKGATVTHPTVQEELELAIKKCFLINHDVNVETSSRTDAGVHALRTSVQVVLNEGLNISSDQITSNLNKHFTQSNIGVRIIRSCHVPSSFSARYNALSRTYLYRFAFRKEAASYISGLKHMNEIPFSEYGRTYFTSEHNINVERMKEAAALLTGTKDFNAFMAKSAKKKPNICTVRTIIYITIKPVLPFLADNDPHSNLYNFLEFKFCGQSFLYKQVRRMVGVLIAVGRGVMSLEDVQLLIDKPEPESWNPRAVCVPPWGLYLLDVAYPNWDYLSHTSQFVGDKNCRATYALYY